MILYSDKWLGGVAESVKLMSIYYPGENHPACPEKSAARGEKG